MFITDKNEYPRYVGDLLLEYPDWKEGDALPTGWRKVEVLTNPEYDPANEVAETALPVEIDGVLTQQWKVRPMNAEEIERRDAPKTAKAKLAALGLTDFEIQALANGFVR